ncbi:MAG: ferrous iron transport protein A [Victivallales bacterium]|nr:ferrous iron transport protein A [Victivallales bacterium]
MIPITMGKVGEKYTIRKISGLEKVRQHLAELGFVVDEDVTVVSEVGGNLILKVKESRIAIGQEIALHILV